MIMARIDGPVDIRGLRDLIRPGAFTSTRGSVRPGIGRQSRDAVDLRNRCHGKIIGVARAPGKGTKVPNDLRSKPSGCSYSLPLSM